MGCESDQRRDTPAEVARYVVLCFATGDKSERTETMTCASGAFDRSATRAATVQGASGEATGGKELAEASGPQAAWAASMVLA
jgi:hypothetical protein